jgi:PPM family protein phosphatase
MKNASDKLKIQAISNFSSKGARSAQEDYILTLQEKGIFVIADGFGGPSAGAEASKKACEEVQSFLVKEAGDLEATLPFILRSYFSLAGNVLFNALIHANRKLIFKNQSQSIHQRGGASVLAGFLDGPFLALANVGACDAWLIRKGEIVELVKPRTYARLQNPFGSDPSPEQAVPLMALGMVSDLEPEIFEYRIEAGDWLIFQTDGLTAEVRDQIRLLQLRELTPDQATQVAWDLFNQGGYQDNSSLSLVIF